MGNVFTQFFKYIFGKKERRILILGLDGAGKTTILHQLKFRQRLTSIPTIGFNVETFDYMNVSFTIWDVGGNVLMRPLFSHYFPATQGLIFVIDSNDRERLSEASEWLLEVLDHEDLQNVPCLLIANKQDLPNAMTKEIIQEKMQLQSIPSSHNWHVQPACAFTGAGLFEGFKWLATQLI